MGGASTARAFSAGPSSRRAQFDAFDAFDTPQRPATARVDSRRASIAPGASSPRTGDLVLSRGQIAVEKRSLEQIRREEYDAAVRRRYVEERVTRALYMQQTALRRLEMIAAQRHRAASRAAREQAVRAPHMVQRARHADEVVAAAQFQDLATPRFADLERARQRLDENMLVKRGAEPAMRQPPPPTLRELALGVKAPPNTSLMNPRLITEKVRRGRGPNPLRRRLWAAFAPPDPPPLSRQGHPCPRPRAALA